MRENTENLDLNNEETLKQVEEILVELNVIDKSEDRHLNIFEFRGEELSISKENIVPLPSRRKWGETILGAGVGALLVGRLTRSLLGKEGAILGTVLGTLLGGMIVSYFNSSSSKEVLIEEKLHPVITVKEAIELLKEGRGFYVTERHKIEAEDGANYDVTHWVKIDNIDDLISFYNIETGKSPRNDFERIGQLLDQFDYKILSEDGSIFYHAEGAPFTDAKKILQGKGVNIRKYKIFRKEIINRDLKGNIIGFGYEDTGEDIVSDRVSTEAELNYLLEHY
ncbi:MAG TPA: hypothetical protein PL110_01850 [Candidatus Eremiobacteraeota bacterium]|nr:hypothetical protein [Candidatus Eremiobacteraeota bacterium]